MKRILAVLLALLLVNACSKKTAPDSNSTSEIKSKSSSAEIADIPETRTPEIYRLVLSFYSIGEGTDGAAIDNFNHFISNFQNSQPNIISVEETPWGREGEIDYCIKFSANNPDFQKDFVATVKSLLTDCQLVHINENTICRHKR
jgi:hypothetical protein